MWCVCANKKKNSRKNLVYLFITTKEGIRKRGNLKIGTRSEDESRVQKKKLYSLIRGCQVLLIEEKRNPFTLWVKFGSVNRERKWNVSVTRVFLQRRQLS